VSAGETGSALLADAIVVAAGSSSRMAGTDKLTALLGGRPLLAWTLDALDAASSVERIVLVTSESRIAELVAADWLPGSVVAVVPGGDHRAASVAAGLAALDELDAADERAPDRVVLVHDGARPLVSPALVDAVAAAAARYGAAIAAVPVAETIERVRDSVVVETVDRTDLVAAQTPQGARRSFLREALRRFPADGPRRFTDEASLLEACSIAVHVVDGEPGNIKVTVPADLARVGSVVGARARSGIGHDSHPFGPGRPLILGGVEIAGAPRLHGHSDGDVVLHAICDALLGAAGLGDLGRIFPAGPTTPQGIDSGRMLSDVLGRVRDAGLMPVGVDVTVTAARPRLGSHLDRMRESVARLLGVAPEAVNVKASTGNLDGMEGAGRGVSALVVATLGSTR
jgi:2-C-methyl-D-erythritol 4-phosphate cytidylyltransferase/2-C-methyl-D-erythritol 2,4-cyclodiphosphate synthase